MMSLANVILRLFGIPKRTLPFSFIPDIPEVVGTSRIDGVSIGTSLSWKTDVELGILTGGNVKASDVGSRDVDEDVVFGLCSLGKLDGDPENIGVENL